MVRVLARGLHPVKGRALRAGEDTAEFRARMLKILRARWPAAEATGGEGDPAW